MKSILKNLALLLFTGFMMAQAPNKMSFQSVVRDASGDLITNSPVGIKISVLQTSNAGTSVYSETHATSTNINGLASLEIGTGSNQVGAFTGIDWSAGPYFLKVESDPTGGTNYTISGTSELMSVPYALFAANSGSQTLWSLNGNSNIDDTIDFFGTTNDKDLIIKRNNIRAGRLGVDNTSFGSNSLGETTTGIRNTAVGSNVLPVLTTGTLNVGVGESTLFATTTGQENSALGAGALYSNTTGNSNTAVGRNAMTSSTLASSNTAIGQAALRNTTVGNFNTALGRDNMRLNTSGNENTSAGVNAMYANTLGNQNAALGVQALRYNTTGSTNTAIGFQSLFANTSGSNNSALGRNAFATGNSFSNSTAIGANTVITASNQIRVGDANITSIGGEVSWTTLSDGRFKVNVSENVPGLSFISKLKPVTYNVDKSLLKKFQNNETTEANGLSELTVGFIAQDVEKVANEIGFDFNGVDKPKNESDYYGIRYSDFVAPMVKAIQEQQTQIETLQQENTQLKQRLDAIEQLLLNKK